MRTECGFCDVEHEQGDCLNQDLQHFKGAIALHAMRPNIRFVDK